MLKSKSTRAVLTSFALLIGSTTSAFAASLQLGVSQTASGITGSTATINTLSPSTSYTYGNTYFAPTSPITGSSYGFYDDYIFSIPAASANSITSTFNLSDIFGINNLQVRLYSANQPTLPQLGFPVNGGIVNGWTQAIAPGVTTALIQTTALGAGNYVLEVRGNVTGTSGGSYAGVFNVAAVPVPAAAWLFGTSLIGLAGATRKRKIA